MRVLHYDAAITLSLDGHGTGQELAEHLSNQQTIAPLELSAYLNRWLCNAEEIGLEERLHNTRLAINELLLDLPLLDTGRSLQRRWDLRRAMSESDHIPYAALAWAFDAPLVVTSEEVARRVESFCSIDIFTA